MYPLKTRQICRVWYIIVLFPLEEPEEEVSFEDLEERAKSGEAKAQTKVSAGKHIAKMILNLMTICRAQSRSAK